MKIGIDARMYGAQYNRGIGRYIEKLLENLSEIDHQNDYTVFLANNNYDDFKESKNFKKVKLDVPWYSWSEQIRMTKILSKYNFDLVHFPHINVPVLYSGKFIVTIHDLIMTHYPGNRSTTKNSIQYNIKIGIAKWLVNCIAKKADLIITPTNYTKKDVKNILNINDKKIEVIYEGVSKKKVDCENFNFEKNGINKEYFLYVGAAYPHKNLDMLIDVFKNFNSNSQYQLVLVGPQDFFYQRLKKEKILNDKNIVSISVSDSELVEIYKQALGFVFPSQIEGFGLPPLEAMSYGCPVISSNSSCLPEILGDAVWYFENNNKLSLLDTFNEFVNNLNKREKFISVGKNRIERFSWKKMATETMNLYIKFK